MKKHPEERRMTTDEEALAAVRSIPHPREHCCKDCLERKDRENNLEAWAVVQGRKEQ